MRDAGLRPCHGPSDPTPPHTWEKMMRTDRRAHAFRNSYTDWPSKQRHRIGTSGTFIFFIYMYVATHAPAVVFLPAAKLRVRPVVVVGPEAVPRQVHAPPGLRGGAGGGRLAVAELGRPDDKCVCVCVGVF